MCIFFYLNVCEFYSSFPKCKLHEDWGLGLLSAVTSSPAAVLAHSSFYIFAEKINRLIKILFILPRCHTVGLVLSWLCAGQVTLSCSASLLTVLVFGSLYC